MDNNQQKQFVDITEISQRVNVEKPYFAFQQLCLPQ